MKKILTLFAMLLVTASTLLAQAPLSYQMVVRSKVAHGDFKPNDLVFSQQIQGELKIFEAGKTQPSYIAPINDKTNMNGMLSLTIGNVSQVDVTSEVPSISNINWKGAKIVVLIPAYGIQDTMDIYPVPYALFTANRDDAITTEEIVKYLKKIDASDFEKIITAFYGNPSTNPTLEKYVVDTVLNYIKANRTAVRNMLLNWLGQMDESDLDTAYKMVTSNTDIVNFINKHAVQYAKDHKSDAKEIALYYVGQTTRGDVKQVLDAVTGNTAFDTVATIIADTAVKYVEAHPEMVRDLAQYYIDRTTVSDVNNMKTYLNEHNEPVYTHVKHLVDSMIQQYLDSMAYIHNRECDQYDICSLLAAIQTLENSEFVSCPDFSPIDTVRLAQPLNGDVATFVLRDTFTNNSYNVDLQHLGKDSLIYVVSYPNTIYPNDTLQASLQIVGNDTLMTDTLNITQEILANAQIINVQAFARPRCKSILSSDVVTIQFPLNCPQVVELTRSDTTADAIRTNNGIVLKGKVNNNYKDKIDTFGFFVAYIDVDATTYKQVNKVDTLYAAKSIVTDKKSADYNTFYAVLDMSHCSKVVTVNGFVKCKDQGDDPFQISEIDTTFHVRGPELNILASSDVYKAFADSIVLTQKDSIYSSKKGWKSIQYYIDNATEIWGIPAQEAGFGNYSYNWKDTNLHTATYKVAPEKDSTYYGWIELQYTLKNVTTTCKVYDSVKITYEPYRCADTIKVGDRVLRRPEVIISSDPTDSTYRTSLAKQGKQLVLSATSRLTDTINGQTVYDTINDMKATQMYDGLIKDYKYNWLRYNVANDTLRKGQDTLHLTTYKDSNYVAHVAITLSNDTVCHIFDTILVKYQFECGDSLRTNEHAYATVEVNKACWTKSNMRDTLNFTHGEQTGDISNGAPKYYNTSVLLNLFTLEQRGLLYNHDAAALVCPAGWHLPDTTEWQAMLHYVDTVDHAPAPSQYSFMKVNDTTWRTTYIYKIGAADVWPYCTNGTSTVKFNAYPAGIRQINTLVPQDGSYQSMPLGSFWTATQSRRTLPEGAKDKFYSYYMYPETNAELDKYVYRDDVNKIIGMSVRCVYGPAPEATPATFTCGTSTVTDRDNNAYNTVKIGNQCWMKENLRTSSFADGSAIENGYNKTLTVDQAYYYSFTDYGYHYNWTAVSSDKGLCPEGWIVPSENDFNQLITYLSNNNYCDNNSNNISKALAIDAAWEESGTNCAIGNHVESNNSSKFSAYPAGYICCGNSTSIQNPNVAACFWSSTSHDNEHAYRLYLRHDNANVNGSRNDNYTPKWEAFSVRCIKAEN